MGSDCLQLLSRTCLASHSPSSPTPTSPPWLFPLEKFFLASGRFGGASLLGSVP